MSGLSSLTSVAGSIKLHQFYQNIGIYPFHSNSVKSTFNTKNAIILVFTAQQAFISFGYLLFKAEVLFNFGFEFFAMINYINGFIVYFILFGKRKTLLNSLHIVKDLFKKMSLVDKSSQLRNFQKIILLLKFREQVSML